MQFLVVLTSLLSVASAAAVSPRYPAKLTGGELSKRQSSVCGSNTTPVCCQVDVLGVADTSCGNGKSLPDIILYRALMSYPC
jgi:hypothetical protein